VAPKAAVSTAAGDETVVAANSKAPLPYARKVLVKFLLRAVAISSYAPTSGAGSRPQVCVYVCVCT
jgi:hypothetical protein